MVLHFWLPVHLNAEGVAKISREGLKKHRLNDSSSPVLTATRTTPHSYGKGQNSTPYKIKTPERIGMKFGIVDYVLDISPQNKFGDDRSSGGF